MADSDSSSSEADCAVPSDARIEKQLRDVVVSIVARDDLDNLTVKRVRIATAKDLDLPGDLLTNGKWKSRSKKIIEEEAARQQDGSSQPHPSPPVKRPTKAATPSVKVVKPSARSRAQGPESEPDLDVETKPVKRKSSLPQKKDPKRRRLVSSSPQRAQEDAESDPADSQQTPSKAKPGFTKTPAQDTQDEESELSSLIDDSPPPKANQRKKRDSSETRNPKTSKTKASNHSKESKQAKDISPQDEEIKRLQGYLVKCGIRKLWGKELANFDAPHEKIKHLRGMLEDAGMTGRFSEDKARQIKDERELKADLEAIKEGDEKWGKQEEEPRKRRLAKGLQALQDVVGDDEESD